LTAAQANARSSFVVGRWSVAPIPSFRRPAEGFTTKAPRHQGKTHREIREVREEKTFSPQRRKGHEGRNAKKEVARRWVGSSVVRVMRGHKAKMITTEITEDTES
jgi:hypothetical protein